MLVTCFFHETVNNNTDVKNVFHCAKWIELFFKQASACACTVSVVTIIRYLTKEFTRCGYWEKFSVFSGK